MYTELSLIYCIDKLKLFNLIVYETRYLKHDLYFVVNLSVHGRIFSVNQVILLFYIHSYVTPNLIRYHFGSVESPKPKPMKQPFDVRQFAPPTHADETV